MCVDYFSYLTVYLSVCLSELSVESFGLFVHVFPYKNRQLFVKILALKCIDYSDGSEATGFHHLCESPNPLRCAVSFT